MTPARGGPRTGGARQHHKPAIGGCTNREHLPQIAEYWARQACVSDGARAASPLLIVASPSTGRKPSCARSFWAGQQRGVRRAVRCRRRLGWGPWTNQLAVPSQMHDSTHQAASVPLSQAPHPEPPRGVHSGQRPTRPAGLQALALPLVQELVLTLACRLPACARHHRSRPLTLTVFSPSCTPPALTHPLPQSPSSPSSPLPHPLSDQVPPTTPPRSNLSPLYHGFCAASPRPPAVAPHCILPPTELGCGGAALLPLGESPVARSGGRRDPRRGSDAVGVHGGTGQPRSRCAGSGFSALPRGRVWHCGAPGDWRPAVCPRRQAVPSQDGARPGIRMGCEGTAAV